MSVTNQDLDTINSFCNAVTGYSVKQVVREDDWCNRLFLVLTSPHQEDDSNFQKVVIHTTNAFWRLETSSQMLCASFDNARLIDKRIPHLVGKKLISARVKKPVFEASFLFESGLFLHFFPISAEKLRHWSVRIVGNEQLMDKWK